MLGRGGAWSCKGISSGYLTWEVGAAIPMDVLTSWDLKDELHFDWRKKRERERRGDKVKSHVKLTGQTDSPKEPSRSYWGPSVATAQRVRGELRQASAGEEVKRLVVMPQAPISHYSCSIDIEKLSLPPLHTPLSGAGVGIWAVCWARSTTTYSGRCCDFTECVLCLTYLSP